MGVEFKDMGLELIMSKIAKLSKLKLTIGFQGETAMFRYPSKTVGSQGPNLASVATWMEFGVPESNSNPAIPARPLLRSTFFTQRDTIVEYWAESVERMIERPKVTALDTLAWVGIRAVKLVERQIDTSYSWARRNAPRTIKNKGFDYPLHETDKMSKSITWAVRGASGRILATGGSNG